MSAFDPKRTEKSDSTLRLTLNTGLHRVGCGTLNPLPQNGPFRAVSFAYRSATLSTFGRGNG